MQSPLVIWPTVLTTEEPLTPAVCLKKARTLSTTVRLTYTAQAAAAADVNIYYSPDGRHWDTVPIDTYAVNLTAGATVQESNISGLPEHGWFKIGVVTADAETLSNVMIWYSIQSWEFVIDYKFGGELREKPETYVPPKAAGTPITKGGG